MIPEIAMHVTNTLCHIVAPMLGPSGRDVLLETDNRAAAVVTGSGHVVLAHVLNVDATENKENALAQYLLHQLNDHNEKYGDGCTSVMLMVAAGLREAVAKQGRTQRMFLQTERHMVRLSHALQWIRRVWVTTEYFRTMTTHWATVVRTKDVVPALHALLVANLAGKFESGAVQILAQVIREWMLGQSAPRLLRDPNGFSTRAMQTRINHIVREWPVLKASGASIDKTQILDDEVLVTRPFFREQSWAKHNYRSPDGVAICFVVVTASFVPASSSQLLRADKVETCLNDAHVQDVIHRESNWSKICVNAIANAGIQMLVCTEALPNTFAGHLRRRNVLAIDHVDPDQAKLLCERSGIEPVIRGTPKAFEAMQQGGNNMNTIGQATTVGRVTLGGTNCVYIRGLQLSVNACTSGQLLLRAGSDGLLRQYERAIRRCVIVVQQWLLGVKCGDDEDVSNNGSSMCVVRGGGSTEAAGQAWCLHLAEETLKGGGMPTCLQDLLVQEPNNGRERRRRGTALLPVLKRSELGLGFQVLAAMFGSVPLALSKRRKGAKGTQHLECLQALAFNRSCLQEMDERSSANNSPMLGFLCAKPTRLELVGAAVNSTNTNHQSIETVAGRMANVLKAIDVVAALLRIDDVMKVSSVPNNPRHGRRLVRRRGVTPHSEHEKRGKGEEEIWWEEEDY